MQEEEEKNIPPTTDKGQDIIVIGNFPVVYHGGKFPAQVSFPSDFATWYLHSGDQNTPLQVGAYLRARQRQEAVDKSLGISKIAKSLADIAALSDSSVHIDYYSSGAVSIPLLHYNPISDIPLGVVSRKFIAPFDSGAYSPATDHLKFAAISKRMQAVKKASEIKDMPEEHIILEPDYLEKLIESSVVAAVPDINPIDETLPEPTIDKTTETDKEVQVEKMSWLSKIFKKKPLTPADYVKKHDFTDPFGKNLAYFFNKVRWEDKRQAELHHEWLSVPALKNHIKPVFENKILIRFDVDEQKYTDTKNDLRARGVSF